MKRIGDGGEMNLHWFAVLITAEKSKLIMLDEQNTITEQRLTAVAGKIMSISIVPVSIRLSVVKHFSAFACNLIVC